MISIVKDKLFEHGWIGIFILIAVFARLLFSHEPITVVRVLRVLVAGVFIGALVSLTIADMGFSDATKGAIVGTSAVLSEDLLSGLLRLGHAIKENPGKLGEILMGRFLGGR